jgi:hypothetical protein
VGTIWQTVIISLLGGSVAAWSFELVRSWWRRPMLRPQVDKDRGSLVETKAWAIVTGQDQHEACAVHKIELRQKYARVIVENRGRTMANNCAAAIREIKRTTPSATDFIFRSDLIDVSWSHWPELERNVPAKAYKILDLCHTMIDARDLTQKPNNAKFFVGQKDKLPERLVEHLVMNAEYELCLDVYADNAAPTKLRCRVKVGKNWDDVDIFPLP